MGEAATAVAPKAGLPADAADPASDTAADARRRPDKRPTSRGTVRIYWRLAGGYWRGPTARQAWSLTGVTFALVILNIGVQYGINKWNAYFFDGLERHQSNIVLGAIGIFALLAFASSALAVAQLHGRMRLQVHWRRWLTECLVARWLGNQRFYRLTIAAPDLDSPEFRIADDARVATEPIVDFFVGITNAVLTALVFFSVLWTVGGSTEVFGTRVPGFMVVCAVLYSGIMSGSMVLFGRPLIARIEAKNAAEARLRAEMVRVRENAESIALIGGEEDETRGLKERLSELLHAWLAGIKQLGRMTWLMGSNGVVSPVVPLLLCAPKFLEGEMTLGALMQTAAAFVQVQVALNWLFDNYPRIAEWLASAGRVTALWSAFSDLDQSVGEDEEERITIESSPDQNLYLDGLQVAQHNGRVVIDEADAAIAPGDKVLLTGESGTGKSTLIRALAGLWPWGSGRVLVPEGARIAFLPQRAYIPNGTLRQVLDYPAQTGEVPDAVLEAALDRVGLRRLLSRLDEEDRWDKVLSGGEQQRIAFARLLVHRPDVVIMDEATSALDTASQDSIMELFRNELANVTVVSVAHRPELEEYHSRKLSLRRTPSGTDLQATAEEDERSRTLARLLRRGLRPRPSPDPSMPISH